VLLVWNVSASAPVGLYRVRANEPVKKGDMVIAWTPKVARRLAAARRYVPLNVPLVKRVAARAGDRVCAVGKTIGINGRRVALRLKTDAAGRPMPWWFGCRKLRTGEYFLLMGRPDSFDGRYFGFSDERDLVGRAVLLWAKPAKGSNGG
jgi:conjugative transfer signal peptidase TraF